MVSDDEANVPVGEEVVIALLQRLWRSKGEPCPLTADETARLRAYLLGSGQTALPMLREASKGLYDHDGLLRLAVIELTQAGPAALPVLRRMAVPDAVNGNDRFFIAWNLYRLGAESLPLLQELSKDEDEDVRDAAFENMREYGPAALPWIEELASSDDRDERHWAAATLEGMAVPAARMIPILRRLADDEDTDVRDATAGALAAAGAEGWPLLLAMVRRLVPPPTKWMLLDLGNFGPVAIPELIPFLATELHAAAWSSLCRIGAGPALAAWPGQGTDPGDALAPLDLAFLAAHGPEHQPALQAHALAHPSELRLAITEALAGLGPAALPALQCLARDPSWEIRREAAHALDRLQPGSLDAGPA